MADQRREPYRGDDLDDEPEDRLQGYTSDDMDDEIPIDFPMTKPLIKSSGDFVRGFEPPEYLLDGILQGGFLYSLTGSTGSGKTAIALEVARSVAGGQPVGGREVEPGRVIYFAGENPDDVRQRWIAMAEHVGFDMDEIGVSFVEGVIDFQELKPRLSAEVEAIGDANLVIIDTSAAYFLGDDENKNPLMGAYARALRSLTTLPGNPTVLVNCHPIKNATGEQLLPRGGGAFIAEVDGNLTCTREGAVVGVHWQGKFRGADFDPLAFETRKVTAERLKTKKGKSIATVIAVQLSEGEVTERDSADRNQEDTLISFLAGCERPPSIADIAQAVGLMDKAGKPQKSVTSRLIDRLVKVKLLAKGERGSTLLTDKGKAAAKAIREAGRG